MRSHKDEDKQEQIEQRRRETQAEFERLNALSLAALAVEVMVKGFGPGGPGADDDAISLGQANIDAGPTALDIARLFVPDRGTTSPSPEDRRLEGQITKLVADGLQQLEHASLIRCQMHTSMGHFDWAATRRGRAALESGALLGILQATAP